MANVSDSITVLSTGSAIGFTMPSSFTPTELEFRVFSKNGSSTSTQWMNSKVDSGGYATLGAIAKDNSTTTPKNTTSTTKCISVWEYVSGTWTEVVAATFHSFTSTGFKLNVSAVNSNYTIFYTART